MHAILEGMEYDAFDPGSEKIFLERKRPLGFMKPGLFVVEGNSENELIEGLSSLLLHMKHSQDTAGLSMEFLARSWFRKNGLDPDKTLAVSIVAENPAQLETFIHDAKTAVSTQTPRHINGTGGVSYSPSPLGPTGQVAFVFPGSGNHYVGMGRGIGVLWPEILRKMDADTPQLKTQLIPECYVPWRTSWETGWENKAHKRIVSDPLNMIFGQVVHGSVMTRLVKQFGIKPDAVIGYSLGNPQDFSPWASGRIGARC
jgi:acyl transferase domain-containing protein